MTRTGSSEIGRGLKFGLSAAALALLGGAPFPAIGAAAQEGTPPAAAAPAAQETPTSDDGAAPELDAATKERYEKFERMMNGARLVGRFSIIGRNEGAADQEEEYLIRRVTKSTEGDLWVFMARIKYGDNDYTVPLPIEVKWAGETPVITLTDFTILGQGPFSARVVLHDGKYAGTWSHGEVGGHLIGRIVKDEAADPPQP
ncbi:MAG TPA: hypothetical protein DCQ98_22375 [Planctomycetaceae bacterium]|nr:hypothetical protein [Planctomycetaceae bacterium]